MRDIVSPLSGFGSPFGQRRDLLNATAIARLLFSADEPGFFYDFDDWSTLFQDTAGTTPVTAPEQGVALALDKSGNDNHATQATTAARPLTAVHPDGGVRNEVDGSDTLATQTVTVTAQERTLSFRGTGTVTLSGASTAGPLVGTGADDIVSLTFTPTAGNLTLTVSGAVNDAMLELGAVRTNYQRRVNFLNVTEAGKRSIRRLYFNGTSHSMTTPTITPNTDKAQVFAGVRKLSDAAAGTVSELSPSISSNNGSIAIFAPAATGGVDANRLTGAVGDAGTRFYRPTDEFAAPISAVATLLADIAADRSLRLNGVSVGGETRAGTGNFLPYQTFIGARAGTSLFFNGFLDQLITRFGPNLDTATIEKTEKYVSTKSPEVETL